MKRLRQWVFMILPLLLEIPGLAANPPIEVQVLDKTETEGLAGVVLLISPVQSHKVQAYVTDSKGRAFAESLNGSICTVTALDPAGLFYNSTTEFDCDSSPVTLILSVRPIIDKVSLSDSVKLKIAIYGPDGKALPKQNMLLRPSVMTFETTGTFLAATDESGMIDAQLSPGEYTLATLIEGKPFEVVLLVAARGQKCPGAAQNCVQLNAGSHVAKPMVVHLR